MRNVKLLLSLKLMATFALCMVLLGYASMTAAAPVSTNGPDYKVSPITITKDTTILLCCHMQNDIVNPKGKLKVFGNQAAKAFTVEKAAKALKAARGAGLMVWHLNTFHRPGYPEYGRPPLPAQCAWIKKEGALLQGSWGNAIVDACKPVGEEPIIFSPTVGGLAQGDMASLLQGWGIKNVILMGVSTAAVVTGTTIGLKDHAFKVTILGDCCSARNWEEHNFMLKYILPQWATITNLDQFIKALK